MKSEIFSRILGASSNRIATKLTLKRTLKRLLREVFAAPFMQSLAKAADHVVLGPNTPYKVQRSGLARISESFIAELLSALAVNCVIDVGANEGQFGRGLRRAGYNGLILSFEPNAEALQILEAGKKTDENWKVFPYALGPEDGTKLFHFMIDSVFSSFLPPENKEAPQFTGFNDVSRSETISLRKLSSVLQEQRHNLPAELRIFLKMDTQGFDLEVMKGIDSFVSDVVALQSEISIVPIYRGMPHYLESLNVYESMNFVPSNFFLVNRQPSSLKAVEVDCVMVKRGADTNSSISPRTGRDSD
jgi:FkbM family methyltransferase